MSARGKSESSERIILSPVKGSLPVSSSCNARRRFSTLLTAQQKNFTIAHGERCMACRLSS